MIILRNRYAIYPLYICRIISKGRWWGGGGGGRNNNISDNNSYIQIILYYMFIILVWMYHGSKSDIDHTERIDHKSVQTIKKITIHS